MKKKTKPTHPDDFADLRKQALRLYPESTKFCMSCGYPNSSPKLPNNQTVCARCDGTLSGLIWQHGGYEKFQKDAACKAYDVTNSILPNDAIRETRKPIGMAYLPSLSYVLIKRFADGRTLAGRVLTVEQLEKLKINADTKLLLS